MVNAISREIASRSDYLSGETIQTIYFGGGTPSLLSQAQLDQLLEVIYHHFEISTSPEITIEVNPEDLTQEKLEAIKSLHFNRLSIGFQTFDNSKLNWMNRVHSTEEAVASFANARKVGFNNISIDLIYALPDVRNAHWEKDLDKALNLSPEHLSIYGLTIEEKTVFGHLRKKGSLVELPEEEAATQYLRAIEKLQKQGYEHYEVANFCKPGYASRHNTAYWQGTHYLGIGPGAHSFNGHSRRFNSRNNAMYIRAIGEHGNYFQTEQLTPVQQLNEHLLTGLRTSSGIAFDHIKSTFEVDLRTVHATLLSTLENQGLIKIHPNSFNLTPKGFLVADDVALSLFFPE